MMNESTSLQMKIIHYPIYPIRSFHVEFWRCSSLDGQNRTILIQMLKTCGFWAIHIPCICIFIWNEISLVLQDFVHQPCGWVHKQFFQPIPTGLVGIFCCPAASKQITWQTRRISEKQILKPSGQSSTNPKPELHSLKLTYPSTWKMLGLEDDYSFLLGFRNFSGAKC